jgi:heat shock protein HslJ
MRYFYFITVFVVAFVALNFICKQNFRTSSKMTQMIDGKIWRLMAIKKGEKTLPIPDSILITARFRKGTIDGQGGCSYYQGKFHVDGNNLDCIGLSNSVNECGAAYNLETQYLDILQFAVSYNAFGDTLSIYSEEEGSLVYIKTDKPR